MRQPQLQAPRQPDPSSEAYQDQNSAQPPGHRQRLEFTNRLGGLPSLANSSPQPLFGNLANVDILPPTSPIRLRFIILYSSGASKCS